MHVKGYAAPETQAAAEQARLLIEQAEALGEPPEDPLLLFSVLYGFFAANFVAFNGDACRDLAAQFFSLAEKQGATVPRMIGLELMGGSSVFTGDIAEGRAQLDRGIALLRSYRASLPNDAVWRRDDGVCAFDHGPSGFLAILRPRWAAAQDAVQSAREIGQAGSLMQALSISVSPLILCGDYLAAKTQLDEVTALADEKGAALWKAEAMILQGRVSALTGKVSNAVEMITTGLIAFRSTGATNTSAGIHIIFSERLCRPRPFRRCLALHRRCANGCGKGQRKMV